MHKSRLLYAILAGPLFFSACEAPRREPPPPVAFDAGKAHPPASAAGFELRDGDRVVFLGDTFIEREQHYGWIELMLTTRFPDRHVTFRNLGWSADTPAGDSRAGLSLLQAGLEPPDEGWKQLVKQLEDAKPTVVFVGYGMASSFDGEAGLPKFKADYNRLLDTLEKISPGVRFVLLGPIPHENLFSAWPEPAKHNAQLKNCNQVLAEVAKQHGFLFISLSDRIAKWRNQLVRTSQLTENGIHMSGFGYLRVTELIEDGLGWSHGAWRLGENSKAVEPLRAAILRKNEWFFHRSRPANMAYIFGFRKREQGQNAVEIPKFDEFIAAEEKRIAQLRSLKPGVNVPEIPPRIGSLTAKHTEQPHPNFEVADGFEVTLWAENPLLHKPIQMNFDPQGRLWVASSEVYPQIEPGQAATDKIIVLEDTKGAGHADKATVFADGLLLPTGVEPGDGGCYVAQSTELLHFKDTKGTGKADVRRIVLSGFGTEDTHHNLHTLRWGPDGRLYMNQSIYTRTDTETPGGVVRLKGGGTFRFDPHDQRMEILFRGWINSWGHQFDGYGQSFLTDGAGGGGINYGVPGASYVTAPRARRILGSVSPGSYPKFSSLEIIRSGQFPDDWQGDMITCDFRAHRVVRFKISDQGAGYVTQEMPDLLRTTDTTFRPIDVKLGPDGALYIADWSNPIIQHGEVDFRDPRRDHEHGRIWRVTAKEKPLVQKTDFTGLKNPELLDRLVSPNSYEREKAKRVLVERGAGKVLKDLASWAKKQTGEKALLQALWTYQAFNQPQPDLLNKLLAAKDAHIRAAAVRVMSYWPAANPGEVGALGKLVADENPRVRLEAVRALGRIHSARAAEIALTVLDKPMDPFLDYALWLTVNDLAGPWIAALKSGAWEAGGREKQLEFALKAIEPETASTVLGELFHNHILKLDGSGPGMELIGSAGGPKEISLLAEKLFSGGKEFDPPTTLRALKALNEAARLRNVKPAGGLESVALFFPGNSTEIRSEALRLAGAWKQLKQNFPRLAEIAGSPQEPAPVRQAAFDALREIGGSGAVEALAPLCDREKPLEIRRAAVIALAGINLNRAVPPAVEVLAATLNESEALGLWRALLNIKGAGPAIARNLPKSGLPEVVAKVGLRAAREGGRKESELEAALSVAASATSAEQELTPEQLRALAALALKEGDPARGELIYRRPALGCLSCHAIGGVGGKVGPDMTSIGASAPMDYLVESVLYPNRKIKEGYHSIQIETKDEQEFSGILVREDERELVLRNAANQEVSVAKSKISKRANGLSLMPAGLADTLPQGERLDLFRFLSELGKPGPYDASQGGVARAWKLLAGTHRIDQFGEEKIVASDFTQYGWENVSSLVDGRLLRGDIQAATEVSKNLGLVNIYAGARFQVRAGKVSFKLPPETGALVWIDGKAAGQGNSISAELSAGKHSIILRLDPMKLPAHLRLESAEATFLTN